MSDHIVPLRVYFGVFAALLVLTWLTVLASQYDLGAELTVLGARYDLDAVGVLGATLPLNLMVALAIAVTKATLVVLFFMHVRYSTPLIWIVVAAGVVWLGILLLLTFADYWSRGWPGSGSPGT